MSFQQFDEFVLVTRAGYVKLIKNNGEFLELGVSSNQLTFTEAIVHNNYLYFMANSPGTGRQVYRLLPQNITHTDDTHWVWTLFNFTLIQASILPLFICSRKANILLSNF
ncbi:MAG: hypothetical protein IPK46_00785 [Saprospiraceae bacterium]|nr:hypothetical protein [Saprospiraceae bacterium]